VDIELEIKFGKSRGRSFTVKEGSTLTFGRGMQADVQMFDDGLSRIHASVENKGDDVVLADMGSANGTYANGKAVASTSLFQGDQITMGMAVIEVVRGPVREQTDLIHTATTQEDGEKSEKGSGTEYVRKVSITDSGLLRLGDNESVNSLRRAHRDLVTIYRVANTINAISDPRELADSLALTVLDVTKGERAAVLLGTGPEAAINPVVSRQRDVDGDANIAVSRTVAAEVITRGVSVLSRNVPEEKKYQAGESLIMQRVQSLMCVPLLAQGNLIGALYVDSLGGTNAFDEKDLELLAAIGNQAGIALQRTRLLVELENLFFSSIRSLVAAIDAKDQYTHGHSERVTAFALMLAKQLGFSDHDNEVLRLAGLLHDVGKIGVSESVLNKPGDLTDEEFELVKLHPTHGAEIISNIQSPYVPEIVAGVRHHHERWDGTGYPDGLKGEETPLLARVLNLADAFDAMTSDRPYRKGFSIERAIQIVRDCSGSQFDPTVSAAIIELHEQGRLILPETMALKYTTMATPRIT